ncbi:MAG: hypothetical protein DIZ80_03610 [endosymbiont of Galathealinum brachiosum]|uniref:Uncharacterized protein n=1 Tax=endosymbiont of Galathealinum brachiosum TaxID=2200906 RepID=A0A370DJU3_9GAMM|nr:MAG: hypothetical protein DIZ80_03610 [endosymbiont of Galathealinum brachiosum]
MGGAYRVYGYQRNGTDFNVYLNACVSKIDTDTFYQLRVIMKQLFILVKMQNVFLTKSLSLKLNLESFVEDEASLSVNIVERQDEAWVDFFVRAGEKINNVHVWFKGLVEFK